MSISERASTAHAVGRNELLTAFFFFEKILGRYFNVARSEPES